MNQNPHLFDRNLYRKRRQTLNVSSEAFSKLSNEVAIRLSDRLNILKTNFRNCWQIGFDKGILLNLIESGSIACLQEKEMFIVSDSVIFPKNSDNQNTICCDEEALPIGAESLDLIISPLGFQWVNDLKGVFLQCLYGLKPDGLMIAAIIGEDSLWELQSVFRQAEMEMFHGLSNRFAPLISSKDLGGLLQSVGFSLPVVDRDKIILVYPNVATLLKDIKDSGYTNILLNRQSPPLTKEFLPLVEELYQNQFSLPGGGLQVTLDFVFMSGWRASSTQQQPLKPGSALHSLADVL